MDVPLSVYVPNGTLLKSICGGNRLLLTEGKRSSQTLFAFYSSCVTSGWRFSPPLVEMVADARKILPSQGFAEINLVISHKRRVSINAKVQARRLREERPVDVICLAAYKQSVSNVSQPMVLWKGVSLTAVLDGLSKYGIYDSQLLTVQGWCDKEIKLCCQEGGDLYTVTHVFCRRNLRLAYAMTYASIQARTCLGSVALWDSKHSKLSRRHLVMGLSC